uniref:Reverse transcriptase domain-containing protein n=1 Tax=Megaselia scalaris TaxID=36166 RepID=T1H1U9_MEGSC
MRAAEMITNKSSEILAYADDIDVVGRTTSSEASLLQRLEKEARSRGLRGPSVCYQVGTKVNQGIFWEKKERNCEVVKQRKQRFEKDQFEGFDLMRERNQ